MTAAVKNATKSVWLPVVVAGLALGIAVWSTLYLANQQNVANVKNCQNVLVLRDAVSDIVDRGGKLAVKNPDFSPIQKANAKVFYAEAQRELQHVLCKR